MINLSKIIFLLAEDQREWFRVWNEQVRLWWGPFLLILHLIMTLWYVKILLSPFISPFTHCLQLLLTETCPSIFYSVCISFKNGFYFFVLNFVCVLLLFISLSLLHFHDPYPRHLLTYPFKLKCSIIQEFFVWNI